jgi:hypothetical protein
MVRGDLVVSGAEFLHDGGELGALVRSYDWSRTPLEGVRHLRGLLRV